MTTFSLRITIPVGYSIFKKELDRHVYPHTFTLMAQGSIYMEASCDPDTMTIDKDMDQYERE